MYISHEAVSKEIMLTLFLIGALKTSQPTISNNTCSAIERTTNCSSVLKNLFIKCPPKIEGLSTMLYNTMIH